MQSLPQRKQRKINKMALKILYAGSPEASAKTLEYLYKNQKEYGFEIAGVLTNPPSAKGRKKDLTPTATGLFARENNLPCFEPEHLDSECRKAILPLGADILVCFAYGHIFGPKFLEMFKFGGINLHPSLLPKYRGCTPVPAAIINRDKETAVSIQTLSLKMDEGDILACQKVPLNFTETSESLLNDCALTGAELICKLLKLIAEENRLPEGKAQSGQASYTGIITKEDAKINWNERAEIIEAKIRAYWQNPGAWCLYENQPLKIIEAKVIAADNPAWQEKEKGTVLDFVKNEGIYIKTAEGILCVTKLQKQGKAAMNYKDFMNGARNFTGAVLQ